MTEESVDYRQYDEGWLDVGQGHQIYYAQHGNPKGIPLVMVHGGPGGRSYESNALAVDLDKYRVIRFDQRGTGQSKYKDQLAGQTIENQVQDMECLRQHLNVDQWALLGGSYGTTLSSHYRIAYPEHVSAHFMRAMFFGDTQGSEHIYDGLGVLLAQEPVDLDTKTLECLEKYWLSYERYPSEVDPALNKLDLCSAYNKLMSDYGDDVAQEAGLRFDRMDTSIVTAVPNQDYIDALDDDPVDSLNLTKMFMHYAQNVFTSHGTKRILSGLKATADIPTVLVHGANDYICPVSNAQLLKTHCSNIDIQIIENAGHSPADKPLADAIRNATDVFACKL